MNALDYAVLLATILGIAAYGIWRTRGQKNLQGYLKGKGDANWLVIGLSVMATQASAITFLSTPGQGYESGLGFVQNYFGAPFALIVISVFFLPIYRKLNVYTAYEYLGERFDGKTRLLAAALFLLQRGLGAGITIYAPAIVLSTVFGWNLNLTIICSSLVAIAYTVVGGSDAVTHTQKLQLTVIFAGMSAAFGILLHKLLAQHSVGDVLAVAAERSKLQAVDFSASPNKRYTFWSGLLGGGFLALSYFGTDQSQVQRYIGAASLRQARLGLMFNAVAKIPMQFFILLLGVLIFVFYQFERPPMIFDQASWRAVPSTAIVREKGGLSGDAYEPVPSVDAAAAEAAHAEWTSRVSADTDAWLEARREGNVGEARLAQGRIEKASDAIELLRSQAQAAMRRSNPSAKGREADFIFIRFILDHLPHGLIGLLVTAFFAATLASKSAELNALASTTVVDVYRHALKTTPTDQSLLLASKAFTVLWGLIAMAFALFASLSENLIQATNIVGSIFYGVVLGMFLTAFLLKDVRGTAVFCAAVLSQAAVIVMFFTLNISYLWYNVIGCAMCVGLAALLQLFVGPRSEPRGFEVVVKP